MTLVDQAAAIRSGEELDVAALAPYLADQLGGDSGETLTVLQFPSGYSNLTYMLQLGGRKLVLRRPPFGTKAKTAHDMGREVRVLRALHPVFPYCPKPLLYCEDQAILGCDFYVMEYLPGLIVRRGYPAGFSPGPEQVRQQFETLIDVLAELHMLDYTAAGLADLGKPAGYAERQVVGWSKRFERAHTEDAPGFGATMQWLADNLPAESGRASLIHNDFKMDNVVWDADQPLRLIGVLDWEMATLGDPLMDLGGTLGYWVEADDPDFLRAAQLMPSDLPGAPTRAEAVERYCRRTGFSVDALDFYHCFGLFRLAVIAQQIYYRYYHGQTADRRFGELIKWVHALDRMCSAIISRSTI